MTSRTRDTLLLIAGLPGVIALFLPVAASFPVVPVEHFWQQLYDGMHWPPHSLLQFRGLDWAVALPVPVVLLQAWPLLTDHDVTRKWALTFLVIPLVLQLACAAFVLELIAAIQWSLPRGWLEYGPEALYMLLPMFALSAGNLWLLHRNWRRGWSPAATTEVFMLGTYVVAQLFWLPGGLLAEPVLAPKLMAWTCLVYAVTIALRLRDATSTGGHWIRILHG